MGLEVETNMPLELKDKADICIVLNIFVLIILFMPFFGTDFLMPEEAADAVKTSEHDLDSMTFWYSRLAYQYNLQNPENQAPLFNKSQVNRSLVESYKRVNLKRLVALKNEGTQQFETYHAAATGINNEEKVGTVYQILLDVAAREVALQEVAAENNKEILKVVASFAFLLVLMFVVIRMRIRRD